MSLPTEDMNVLPAQEHREEEKGRQTCLHYVPGMALRVFHSSSGSAPKGLQHSGDYSHLTDKESEAQMARLSELKSLSLAKNIASSSSSWF